MKPNNRITYRFDVQERQPAKDKPEHRNDEMRQPKEEEQGAAAGQAPPSKNNVIPLYQQVAPNVIDEVQPWNNGYQEDIGALEQLIREADAADRSTSDGAESREDEGGGPVTERQTVLSFDVGRRIASGSDEFMPSQETWENRSSSTIVPAITRRSGGKGPSWLHVFLSVSGALATGAIFGYLILTLFTGASIWPGGDAGGSDDALPVVQPAVKETIGLNDLTGLPEGSKDGGKDGGEDVAGNGASPAATVNVKGVSRSYTLLQYGVFSNTEGRDAALKQLKDGGLAAASTGTAEGYRVFAGIALDGAKAGVISSGLPDVALFKKEVSLQAPDRLPFGGGEEAANTFFVSTNELIGTWSDLVVAQLEQPSLSPLGAAASEGWRARHEQWTAYAGAMQEGLSDETGKTYFAKLRAAIDTAAASMAEYDQKPSKAHLWSAETALMEAVLVQKEWFESTSAL